MKFAVQLYSVRDHIKTGDDMLRILGEVKKIGFDGVEFAGYAGLSAEVLAARCNELGLTVVGTHLGLDDYSPEKVDDTLAFGKTLGCLYMGVGGAPHGTLSEAAHTGDVLKAAGKKAKKLGMDVYYHNHYDEFKLLPEGITPEEVIMARCKLEVDTYWSFFGGMDNYSFLTKNKDKIVLIHIKDGKNGQPMALGEGDNDLKKVVLGVKAIGLSWVILENDDPVPNGLADITRSFAWMKKNF